jgi:hypothetical protein
LRAEADPAEPGRAVREQRRQKKKSPVAHVRILVRIAAGIQPGKSKAS